MKTNAAAPTAFSAYHPLFVKLRQQLPLATITDALAATSTASCRLRRLPAAFVVLLMIAAALFRHVALARLVRLLGLSLPADGGFGVASSALTAARRRLGAAPFHALLRATRVPNAAAAGAAPRWRGWQLVALDGSRLRAPDSAANRAHFGGHRGGHGDSAYPLVRFVVLLDVATRRVLDAAVGAFGVGERTLADALLASVPARALVLLDAGFFGFGLLDALTRDGTRAVLVPLTSRASYRVVRVLGPGDALVVFTVSSKTRARHPQLGATFAARVVTHCAPGFRPRRFLTTLCDAVAAPKAELGALYAQRWEVELALGDGKTHLLAREEALRSRTPALVTQEVYAWLLAHNVLRAEGVARAAPAGVVPARVSFVGLRDAARFAWAAAVAARTRRAPALDGLLLPPRRTARRCPRVVKLGRGPFPPAKRRLSPAERFAVNAALVPRRDEAA